MRADAKARDKLPDALDGLARGVGLLREGLMDAAIGVVKQQQAVRGVAISARAPSLLVVGLDAAWDVVVDDRPDIPPGLGPVADFLKVLLKMRSEDSDVAQKLLASSADLDLLAAFGAEADVPAPKGWRHEVFGNDALKLIKGEIGLAISGKRIKVVPARD